MEWYKMSGGEVLNEFSVTQSGGLTEEQVKENRKQYGENKFSEGKKTPLIKKILLAFREPMVLILIIAVLITLVMNTYKVFAGLHAEFTESIGILIAIFLSVTIQLIMEGKSEKAFDALNNINDDIKVKVIRNGAPCYIGKTEVVVGDIVKLEIGDKAPADGRLIFSRQLKVDESMLTGESIAVDKDAAYIETKEKSALSDRVNMIYSGTFVTFGNGTMVVTSVGDHTEMGNIASELKDDIAKSTPLQEKLDRLAKGISVLGITIAVLVFAYEVFKIAMANAISFDSIQNAFMTSIALIVAAVPEGLPTIVAMTLALNVIKMAKSNALVRKLVACETVGSINVICSDKTGTLTKNQMSVIDVWENGKLISPKHITSQYLINNFVKNSTADISFENGKTSFVGNPTECALLSVYENLETGKNYQQKREEITTVFVYPFSSDKKSMTTVVAIEGGSLAYTKGSPEKVISLCSKIMINGEEQEFTEERKQQVTKEIEVFQEQAKRTLGFAHRYFNQPVNDFETAQNIIESDMVFDGFVSIADPIREDVYDAVATCRKAGISIKMLTGDNIVTARSIARELNLLKPDSLVVEAQDIDDMSDEELAQVIDRITVIARSKPLTKMRIVNMLKSRGNVVAVTGDGINDAPALKNADVGIAMGITGTEVSKEASDIILLDDSFSTIVKSVRWGRGIYENFQRFIQFQLTVNVVAVLTVVLCEILGHDMPFTTIQLLWVNLIMDGPPAISLGLEALRSHLMEKEPIQRDSNIISRQMLFRIVSNGLFISAMMLLLIAVNPLGGTAQQQPGIIFTTFVLFQLFNAFNSRELNNESIFRHILNNKIMLLTMAGTFLLQVVITQFGGKVFNTAPLSVIIWLKMLLYTFSVVVFSELVKFIKRTIIKIKN